MINNYLWIVLLIVHCSTVCTWPIRSQREGDDYLIRYNYDAQNKPKENQNNEQVISVRITSSVAVGRGGARNPDKSNVNNNDFSTISPPVLNVATENIQITKDNYEIITTGIPPNLVGANIEFIKQLNAKKETKRYNSDQMHPFQLSVQNQFIGETAHLFERTDTTNTKEEKKAYDNKENFRSNFAVPFLQNNETHDSMVTSSLKNLEIIRKDTEYANLSLNESVPSLHSTAHIPFHKPFNTTDNDKHFDHKTEDIVLDTIAEPSIKSVLTFSNTNDDGDDENIENVPLARSVPLSPSSQNYIQGLTSKSSSERGNSLSLTTVSFDITHDKSQPLNTNYNNEHSNSYANSNIEFQGARSNFYEPPKIYSQPAKIYSEPAKFYSEPAKIYSEPAKIYSEPAKIYSEPAKIYSEPAKFYSEPASLHLTPENVHKYTPWQSTPFTNTPWNPSKNTGVPSTVNTTPVTVITIADEEIHTQHIMEHLPEKNYEVDEKISVMSDGRSHGIQETSTEKCKQDNCKVGYVVEGRQYKKYRVEERTPDGFIVGEYGVVRNEDGALRGVRYTADGDASPRLIYDALMKFLQLK